MSSSITEDWNELLNTILKISQTAQGNRKDYLHICRTIKKLQNLSQRASHPLYADLIDVASCHAQSIANNIWNSPFKTENYSNFTQELIEESMIPQDLIIWPKVAGSLFFSLQSNKNVANAVLEQGVSINARKLYSLGTSTRPQNICMWYHLHLKSRKASRRDWNSALERQVQTHEIQEDCDPNDPIGLSLDDCKQIWSRIEDMNLSQWLITCNGTSTLPSSLMEDDAFMLYHKKRYKVKNCAPLEVHQPTDSMTIDRHSSDEIGLDGGAMNAEKVQSPYIIDFLNDWNMCKGSCFATEVGNQAKKSKKSKHQTNSSGYAMLATQFFVHDSLTRSYSYGESFPRLLIIGQKGSGKATLCKVCACWVGAQVHELNLHAIHEELMAENTYEKNSYLNESLQTKILSIFSTAMETRPAIVLIRDVERVFITNSDRDKESPVAKLARSMKQLLIQQIEKSQGLEKLIIVGTSSYPDDCVGKDYQEFRHFFQNIVNLPLPSQRSRVIKICESLRTVFNESKSQDEEVPKWGLITTVADDIAGCTYQDIDHSMQQTYGTLPDNASLTRALQLFKIYTMSTRDIEHVKKRHLALADWFALALPRQSPKQSKQSIKRPV